MPGGSLTIVCDLTVHPPEYTVTTGHALGVALERAPRLPADIAKLWADPSLADVTLICDGERIPSHKAILAARSDYFRAMFMQAESLEAQTKEVEIKDMKADVLRRVLQTMFTDDYGAVVTRNGARELLTAADRLLFPLLKVACEEALIRDIKLENATDVLRFATDNNAELVRDAAAKFIRSHLAQILGDTDASLATQPELLEMVFQ